MDKHYFKRTTGYYTEHGRYISTLCGPSYAQFCDPEYGHMIDKLDDNQGYNGNSRFRYKHDKFLVDQFQNDDLSIVFNKYFNCEPDDFPFEKDFIKAPVDVIIKKFCEWQEIEGEVILYNINDYPELDTCNIKELLAVELKSFTVLSILHDLDIALRLSSKFFIQKNKKYTELFYAHFHVLLKIHELYNKLYNPDVTDIRYHNIDDLFEDLIKYAPTDERLLLTYSSAVLLKIFKLGIPFHKPSQHPVSTPYRKRRLFDYDEYIQKHFGGFSHAPKQVQYFIFALTQITDDSYIDHNEFYVDFDPIITFISPVKYYSSINGRTRLYSLINSHRVLQLDELKISLYFRLQLLNRNNMALGYSIYEGVGRKCFTNIIDIAFNPALMRLSLLNPYWRDVVYDMPLMSTYMIVSQPDICLKEFHNATTKFTLAFDFVRLHGWLCNLFDVIVLKTLAAITRYDSEQVINYLEALEGNKLPFGEGSETKCTDIFISKELPEKLKLDYEHPSHEILANYSIPSIGKLSVAQMHQLWKMFCDNENNLRNSGMRINLDQYFNADCYNIIPYANDIDHIIINHITSMEQN